MFHLGWFLNYRAQGWNEPFSGSIGSNWTKPDLFVDLAHSAERAGFDYMMFEDGYYVPDIWKGNNRYFLSRAQHAPKHDPMTLLPILAQQTKHLGLIATMATPFYPPYLAARLMSSLDHLSDGRIGVNLVTAHTVRAAQNYGYDEHFEHDTRYEMADEWITLVKALWDSWEPDAVLNDLESGVYVDGDKVHTIDFEGKYYRSRGPLNTMPSPQGHPVICQAGGSPAGKNLAAAHADTVIAQVDGVEQMKAFRDDMSERLIAFGRKPTDLKVLYWVTPIVAETDDDAFARDAAIKAKAAVDIEAKLAGMSWYSDIDFSKYDLDSPLPEVENNGGVASLAHAIGADPTLTLREIASKPARFAVDLVGSPDRVASIMCEAMDECGGDGYFIGGSATRKFIAEITDGLAPELRRRGAIRDGYEHEHLRDNLLAF
jgi:FMN-dependent oxidoreductase (nitrilotriacetate monooxygenase family)